MVRPIRYHTFLRMNARGMHEFISLDRTARALWDIGMLASRIPRPSTVAAA